MHSRQLPYVPPSTARRALIGLVADIAWDERTHHGPDKHQERDEAMSLLSRVDHGDRDAARRAMALVNASGDAKDER